LSFATILLVEDLDVLIVVHLHEHDTYAGAPALRRQGERLPASQELLVELAGLGKVFDLEGHVRNAEDFGAFHRLR
jgi:hypothetical protein